MKKHTRSVKPGLHDKLIYSLRIYYVCKTRGVEIARSRIDCYLGQIYLRSNRSESDVAKPENRY
jgi:hypothetical protein